jgi:hypothetical protein
MESKFELERQLYEENYSFPKYTLEKYNEFIREFNADKKRQLRNVLFLSPITALGLSNGPVVNSIIDAIVHSLKLFWIPPTVYLGRYNIHLASLNGEDFQIDLEDLKSKKNKLKEKQINFQLTTKWKKS